MCRTRVGQAMTVVAILAALGGVAFGQSPSTRATDYVVGPQDVLTITVFEAPEASGKFSVDADGTFTFPMIGRVAAGGQTLRAVEEELRKRLADGFFKNPQISVAVDEYRSQRIFVVGEVRQPGTYPLTGDMTLIEAFARAGSATPEAAGTAVIVRAPPSGQAGSADPAADIFYVDLQALQSGTLADNIELRDGDTIFVPRLESIYVFGQVRAAGAYPIQRGTTVLQALSLAGGVTDRGSTSRLRIIRLIAGKKTQINASLDDVVQPGDTVMVRERFF